MVQKLSTFKVGPHQLQCPIKEPALKAIKTGLTSKETYSVDANDVRNEEKYYHPFCARSSRLNCSDTTRTQNEEEK